jgi:Xaa-Pro aminopeptidase
LAETLREFVPETGRIGLPMGLETHVRMPLADTRRVEQAVKPRCIVDATGVVQRTREIKSEAEIGKLRGICAIAGQAFEALPEIAAPGTPIADVFRAFQAELLLRGADWVSYLAGAAGQGGYADVIAPAMDRPLAKGDVLMLDTGAVKDGYFCDFDRNVFVGPQAAEVYRTQEALWRATEHTLASLRPGMRAADAHRMLSDGIERYGARPCPGRLGHGLGLTLTEWPSFTTRDQTELREGMVLTLEPSAFVDGTRFLVHEENIVLRAGGPELLSPRAPRTGHEAAP